MKIFTLLLFFKRKVCQFVDFTFFKKVGRNQIVVTRRAITPTTGIWSITDLASSWPTLEG